MITTNAFVATSLTAVSLFLGTATPAVAQGSTPPANIGSEVYLASFFKAAPGQAAALLKTLQQQDPKDPMAGHVLLLRHAQGSDWDYALIQHMGPTATVRVPPQPVAGAKPPQPTQAWHTDTFVAGPSWEEFSKQMGVSATEGGVYVVGVQRPVPGHRRQLLDALNATGPSTKVPIGRVTLDHIDGSISILTLQRFNSWQDFATDMVANPSGSPGWNDIRQHSAYHDDTLAERVR